MSDFAKLANEAWQATKNGRELDARLLLGASSFCRDAPPLP